MKYKIKITGTELNIIPTIPWLKKPVLTSSLVFRKIYMTEKI